MLSRRQCLRGLGAYAALAASPVRASPVDGSLTASDVHPSGFPTVEAVRWMSRTLEERTQGRLKIHVYFAGQLGREPDTVDLTRLGALDITRVNFASLNNAFPLTQIFSLPYLFNTVDHLRRAIDGPVGNAVLEGFAKRDLVGLAIYDAGPRCFYNVRRPVIEPKDLEGLKLRVPPSDIFIEFVRALGGNPTPIPFGDVYSGLQTHLIDGAENNWRTYQSSRHFEVAHYWSESDHSHSPEALLMSRRTFDALSAADRELVVATARESVPYMRGLWDRMQAEAREIVIKAGTKVVDVDRPAFERAVQPVLKKYLQHPEIAMLYEQTKNIA
jgi:tripartite ATP-independent transporter DctP family solute receptor